MTSSRGNRANGSENDNKQAQSSQVPRTDIGGNEGPHEGPPKPEGPTKEYQECLEEIAAIVASDTDPTTALAQLALVLSAAEDRGLISPGPSGY